MPPKVKSETPLNESINLVEKNIIVEFDEFIELSNLSSQLIISPLMEEAPDVYVKGKKLVIKIKSELKTNTTYSLNFGDAIRDITEGNIYPNYKYVFSTGNNIDSLKYSGTILNANDLTPKEGVFVMLYDEFEDTIPLTKKPQYIAKTDKEGNYEITNIKEGQYKFFALQDINSNYLFDLPNEEISFNSKLVQIDSSITGEKNYLFLEESEIQYVTKSNYNEYGKLEIEFNLPTESMSVNPIDSEISIYRTEINKEKNKWMFWIEEPFATEKVNFEIIENNEVVDTVEFDFSNEIVLKDSVLKIASNTGAKKELNQKLQYTSPQPILSVDTPKINLYEDSLKVNFNLYQDTNNLRVYIVDFDFKEKTNYTVFIEPNAFTSIYEIQNDTIVSDFKTKRESDYGNLSLIISPPFQQNIIVELWLKNNIIQTDYCQNKSTINYKYLQAGDYSVKLIVDENNNKKWDTGKYIDNLQPEKVIYYQGKITIQENWDNKIDWIIE